MSRNTIRALTLAALLIASALPAWGEDTVFIDFETFPGADGVLGTADDVLSPPCPDNFCFPLTNEYAAWASRSRPGPSSRPTGSRVRRQTIIWCPAALPM